MENEKLEHAWKGLNSSGYRDDSLKDALAIALERGDNPIKLFCKKKYDEGLSSSHLILNKSEKTGKYYLNKIEMAVKLDKGDEVRSYKFSVGTNNRWTQKEAYNMLCGRAVNKDITPKEKPGFNPWLQFNFGILVDPPKKAEDAHKNAAADTKEEKQEKIYHMDSYHPNWGFVLEDVVNKFKLLDPQTGKEPEHLNQDLRRGNRQPVIFVTKDGSLVPGFMEAAPAYKSVNNYDENGVLFPKGHELNAHYRGNKVDVINAPANADVPKEAVAQGHKENTVQPAQKTAQKETAAAPKVAPKVKARKKRGLSK
jgi:hypothetical protein